MARAMCTSLAVSSPPHRLAQSLWPVKSWTTHLSSQSTIAAEALFGRRAERLRPGKLGRMESHWIAQATFSLLVPRLTIRTHLWRNMIPLATLFGVGG